jgi:hypothetical protein
MWYELGAMFDQFDDRESAAEAYRQAAEATGLAVAQPHGERAVPQRS